MSDLPPELLRPAPPPTWRDRLAGVAESLDLSPARMIAGLVVVGALVLGGWHLLDAPPPPIEMQLPLATTAPPGDPADPGTAGANPAPTGDGSTPGAVGGTEAVVHVAGAVAAPGVQRLPADARVVDAIDAAGGAAPDADLGRVNLASPLTDGQQVYVPKVGEAFTGVPGSAAGPGDAAAGGSPPVVHLNTASVEQLDELPGVGPAIAQAIVDHRSAHGPFASIDELLEVRGIGPAKLDEIRPRVAL